MLDMTEGGQFGGIDFMSAEEKAQKKRARKKEKQRQMRLQHEKEQIEVNAARLFVRENLRQR